ncbi:MAG: hypothetical protein RBR45_13405 [Pseudomonas sp.]|nr:hypothetical protein [Pseudomonas sp.]
MHRLSSSISSWCWRAVNSAIVYSLVIKSALSAGSRLIRAGNNADRRANE